MTAIGAIRKRLRPVRRFATAAKIRLTEWPYLLRSPSRGSPDWLIKSEITYGGYVTGVRRQRVSALDQRRPEELAFGGMTGGDRMLHNKYAGRYARYLAHFLDAPSVTLAEIGILKGTGLAIWCDLFPRAQVLGFDIDLDHFKSNRPALTARGAFRDNSPELHEFDQLADQTKVLDRALDGRRLDIVIDDGLHSLEAILLTWKSVKPHLAPRFVYFIEDFGGLPDKAGDAFAGYDVRSFGMLTVVSAGVSP